MRDTWDALRRLMKSRPLPRGPEDAASLPADEASLRRRALELAAIRDGANDLARRADEAGLPLLGYLLDCCALEAEQDSTPYNGAGQSGEGGKAKRIPPMESRSDLTG